MAPYDSLCPDNRFSRKCNVLLDSFIFMKHALLGFFLVMFSSISLFFTFVYLNILIDGVIIFHISFSDSHRPCICYFSADGSILVFIAWVLITCRSSKKNHILLEPGLNMIQPPCGLLHTG